MRYITKMLPLFVVLILVSCAKDPEMSQARIYTGDATDIIGTNATVGGEVINNTNADVYERGICWNTSGIPTTDGNHSKATLSGNSFSVSISGLTINTTYYTRVYVIDENGTYYGNEKTFTTTDELYPDIRTKNVSNITKNSAISGGVVVFGGNPMVDERGICWAKTHNPTIENTHISNGVGVGDYICDIAGLQSNSTYYVRAYTKCNETGKVFYGEEKSFKTQN